MDEQIEYQVWDRATFTRFVSLGSEDCIPDGTTLWLFREKLARAGLIETLFDRFDQHLNAKGYIARGGQMVDASIVPVPKQRNTREENEAVKRGETPAEWEQNPAKICQKDKDARWTKKHGRSFFGYKNLATGKAQERGLSSPPSAFGTRSPPPSARGCGSAAWPRSAMTQGIARYPSTRLRPNRFDFAKLVELFDAHNVSFVSVTQQFNTTTSMGRLTLNVLLSFAQFEREVTSERIRDKIAASKRKGLWVGGRAMRESG